MKKQFRYCWKSCTLISCYQVSIIWASTILFMIGFRRAGIKNWVKYAILHVQMSTPYTYAPVKTRLKSLVLLLNISHIPVSKIISPCLKNVPGSLWRPRKISCAIDQSVTPFLGWRRVCLLQKSQQYVFLVSSQSVINNVVVCNRAGWDKN